MLLPKRVKYRKMHRGRRKGIATRGATVAAPTVIASGATCATIPNSRSRSTVMMRAMSWRTFEIWLEFSSCPTACLNLSS